MENSSLSDSKTSNNAQHINNDNDDDAKARPELRTPRFDSVWDEASVPPPTTKSTKQQRRHRRGFSSGDSVAYSISNSSSDATIVSSSNTVSSSSSNTTTTTTTDGATNESTNKRHHDWTDTYRHIRRKVFKKARIRTHDSLLPSEIKTLFYQSVAALAIYAFIVSAFVLGKKEFLYGIVAVVGLQISWIALKWILYIVDDPDLHRAGQFIKGWCRVFVSESKRFYESNRALWLAGTVTKELPAGIGYARYVIRDASRNMNHRMMEEIRQHTTRFHRRHSKKKEVAAVAAAAAGADATSTRKDDDGF